jgi:hypothetical protein
MYLTEQSRYFIKRYPRLRLLEFFVFVLLLHAEKKNQEKGKKNDASAHRPPPSPPFF